MVLSVSAFFAFVLLFAVDLFATHANPYMGILAYVVAPMFLLMGLAMVLLGYVMESRRIRKGCPRGTRVSSCTSTWPASATAGCWSALWAAAWVSSSSPPSAATKPIT